MRRTSSANMMVIGAVCFLVVGFVCFDSRMLFQSEKQSWGGTLLKEQRGVGATSGKLFEMKRIRTVGPDWLKYHGRGTSNEIQSHNNSNWPKGPFWNHKGGCKNWGAVTTIFPPTSAIESFASLDNWCLVVAGDLKGPESYHVTTNTTHNVVFLSAQRQQELGEHLDFVKATPWNHFARKNIAYLYAIANGAEFVWDFDDDNLLFPNETFSRYLDKNETLTLQIDTRSSDCQAINPYDFFGPSVHEIWPRGYPLDYIRKQTCRLSQQTCKRSVPRESIGIYQSLADKDPDVDALYRLTRKLPVVFEGPPLDVPVLIPSQHAMAPANAQAALFHKSAMWSLFLPTTVHGRVSDIWRSYIAQCLFRKTNTSLAFVGPLVQQDRNAHTYLADLDAEKQLYDRSTSLVSFLLEWEPLERSLEACLEQLYVDLYERGIVEWEDVQLVQMWIGLLQSIGYNFPPLVAQDKADGVCEESVHWVKLLLANGRSAPLPFKSRIDNVVLMGQFNYNTNPTHVIHWATRWLSVFTNVIVRGPFDKNVMDTLKENGIKSFYGKADAGYYSPMYNLGQTLRLYANDTSIRGVLYAHDDLILNMTQLFELGFPSDNEILGQAKEVVSATPVLTVYENKTYTTARGGPFTGVQHLEMLRPWRWWKVCEPGIMRAASSDPRSKQYMDASGGLAIYANAVGDFAYVPTSLAEPFAAIAEWLTDNEVFLECGMPTIFGMLRKSHNAEVKFVEYCTDFRKRSNASAWVPACANGEPSYTNWYYPMNEVPTPPYGIYHPIKLGLGVENWDKIFDIVALGNRKYLPSH